MATVSVVGRRMPAEISVTVERGKVVLHVANGVVLRMEPSEADAIAAMLLRRSTR